MIDREFLRSRKRALSVRRPLVIRACAFAAGSVCVLLLGEGDTPEGSMGTFRSLIKGASGGGGGGFSSPAGSMRGGRAHSPGPVFYNVFVPPDDPAGRANALDIVREQLDQIDSSARARDLPIYYALAGDLSASVELETMCRANGRRECSQLWAEEEGNEYKTLQRVYEYCRDLPRGESPTKTRGNNSSVWVTYFHNKGSFHPSPENTVQRQMTTKAAFSDACQSAPGDMCNVCSARFSPQPFLHSSGNIWTADCEYVRELIPPLYFFPAMEDVFDEKVDVVLGWANGGKGWRDDRTSSPSSLEYFAPAPYRSNQKPQIYDKIWFTGQGRFSMEHWVHSHPNQRPCDVYPGQWNVAHEKLPPSGTDWVPELRRAPRRHSLEDYEYGVMERMREDAWYCGSDSRLYEFERLYGERPTEDNWFWRFYEASKGFCVRSSGMK
mmetsp:Transcript_45794/g.139123  ORF Transcript_45794/g.139123 Transcript_45794/m.139123 type:complete len:439 (-) Transcript_45794:229-1545(-)|eukprot:CAMPEP_0113535546 /NCGR_PEP_ID=MMETSP0015_2-20120614/5768_1 /TAXON_ID=2838 /ORGANISM="Odontella" /LENGTH=438 /DNA_ID=CAMNT_0000434817 /DNA_START=52 /DNA_END=1368 /DNA_ORIENTATION=+ /assembly_acc=CAM_ASM_000160